MFNIWVHLKTAEAVIQPLYSAIRGQIYFRKIEQVSSKNKNIFHAIEAVKKTGEPVRILVNFH